MTGGHRPGVAFVGSGAAGGALLLALRRAGWPVVGVSGRAGGLAPLRAAAWGVAALGSPEAPGDGLRRAPVVLLGVSDASLGPVAAVLAATAGPWRGRIALHLSGSLGSEALSPLRSAGAAVASWHPLATLPPAASPELARPAPVGIPFFAEGDDPAWAVVEALTEAIGGQLHRLPATAKPTYHAAATLAGNLLVVLHAAASDVLRQAGVADAEQALAVLCRGSLENAIASPGLGALTGPVARADAGTLARNVDALAHEPAALRAAHAALSLLANMRLRTAGRGAAEARDAVDRVLREELAAAVAELLPRGSPPRGEGEPR